MIYLSRNEELVPGRRSADAFIYTTPTVRFPDAFLPTLTSDAEIDVATINGPPSCDPVTRSLRGQLETLCAALFADAGVPDNTMQLVVHYDYSINPSLLDVSIPVCMMPPVLTAVAPGGTGRPLAEVIGEQVAAIDAWFAAYQPSIVGASLRFDVTIMSNLTPRPMPILRLTSLYLPMTS
ncbi:MAG TPA: hypothetical protein VIW69_03970, partial [Candidatus Elarobacter sp.]